MESPLVLVQITDSHLLADPEGCLLGVNTDHSLRGVLDDIKRRERQIDMLLVTGDIAQDGSVQAYQRFLGHVGGMGAPVHGLPGNHDARETLQAVWQEHLAPIVDLGSWRIILLDSSVPDSNGGYLADSQLGMLQAAAAQARDRHILVAVHHNPVPMGSGWLDSMTIANGDALLDCLGQFANVRCLLWGHVHQEFDKVHEYSAAHKLRLLATPSTCVQFQPSSDQFKLDTTAPGYRWLKLHAGGAIDTGVQRLGGITIIADQDSGGY